MWIDNIRKDIEMNGEHLEEIQESRKWENRDSYVINNHHKNKCISIHLRLNYYTKL